MKAIAAALVLVSLNAFAAGRGLAPAPLSPSAHESREPSVAYAGGRFLTVWTESLGNAGTRILGALQGADGRVLSPRAEILVADRWPRSAHVVGTGDSFALFVVDSADRIHLVDIDREGRVTSRRVLSLADAWDFRVAWNGTHFLVAVSWGYADFAALLDRSGSIVRDSIPISLWEYDDFAVVATASAFFVVSPYSTSLYVNRISADGLESVRTHLDSTPATSIVATAREDGSVAIAWTRDENSWYVEESVGTAIVDAQGTLVKQSVIASDLRLRPVHLMTAPGGFALALTSVANKRLYTMLLDDGASLAAPFPLHSAATGTSHAGASNGETMLLAAAMFDGTADVRGRIIDRDARIGPPEVLSIVPRRQRAPILGAGNGRALAAFTEETSTTTRVRATMISRDGQPLLTHTIAADAALAARDVAWNGTEFLTAIRRDGKLYAVRLTSNGEAAADLTLLGDILPEVDASIAWAGDRWLVVWPAPDRQHLLLAALTPNALVSSLRTIYEYDGYRDTIDSVTIAFSGTEGIIAWVQTYQVTCNALCFPIVTVLANSISRDVTTLDAETVALRVATPEHISIATNGEHVMAVVDRRNRTEATILPNVRNEQWLNDGAPLSSDVTWDGSAFVVASRGSGLLTVRRFGDFVEERHFTRTSYAEVDTGVSIVSVVPGETIAGVQETSMTDGSRATVFAERDLSELTRKRTVRR